MRKNLIFICRVILIQKKMWSKRKKNKPYICLKIISCSIQTEPYLNATKSVSIVNFNKMSSIDT